MYLCIRVCMYILLREQRRSFYISENTCIYPKISNLDALNMKQNELIWLNSPSRRTMKRQRDKARTKV